MARARRAQPEALARCRDYCPISVSQRKVYCKALLKRLTFRPLAVSRHIHAEYLIAKVACARNDLIRKTGAPRREIYRGGGLTNSIELQRNRFVNTRRTYGLF